MWSLCEELDRPCRARRRPSPESRSRGTTVDEIGRSSSRSSSSGMGPPNFPFSAANPPSGVLSRRYLMRGLGL